MKVKILGAIAGLSVASVGALAGVAVANSATNLTPANAETVQTTRRVWVINGTYDRDDTDEWYKWKRFDCFDVTNSVAHDVTYTVGEYYHGICFIDLPMNCTQIKFQGSDKGDGNLPYNSDAGWTSETVTLGSTITSLDAEGDVYFLGGIWSNTNREVSTRKAGMSSSQLAWFLSFFNTCSSSYANGYNAYPQLMVDFYLASEESARSGTVTKANEEPSDKYTFAQKIGKMRELYNKDHGTNLD